MDRNALLLAGITCNILERMDFRHVTVLGVFDCLGSRVSNFYVVILNHLHIDMCYIYHMDAKASVLKPTSGTKYLNISVGSLFRSSLNRECNMILG